MSKEERTVRVRYSRLEKRVPKNTLVTVKDGDTLYFGIARCNRKLDVFHRKVGSYIAEQRALLARDDTQEYRYDRLDNGLELHESGLRGSVSLSNVRQLINHFEGVDQYVLDNLAPRHAKV